MTHTGERAHAAIGGRTATSGSAGLARGVAVIGLQPLARGGPRRARRRPKVRIGNPRGREQPGHRASFGTTLQPWSLRYR